MNQTKKIIWLVIAAGLAVGVFGLVRWLAQRSTPTVAPGPQSDNVSKIKAAVDELNKLTSNDPDLDGLTNAEELPLKTNPNSADSDEDGLLDADEVRLYKTDPNKSDTHGLGESDGAAVRRGRITVGGKITQ